MKVRTDLKAGLGMGDVVAQVTESTGMDKLAQVYEQVTGKPCGCDERREMLNKLFPLPSFT
jgi:hypothetical protein